MISQHFYFNLRDLKYMLTLSHYFDGIVAHHKRQIISTCDCAVNATTMCHVSQLSDSYLAGSEQSRCCSCFRIRVADTVLCVRVSGGGRPAEEEEEAEGGVAQEGRRLVVVGGGAGAGVARRADVLPVSPGVVRRHDRVRQRRVRHRVVPLQLRRPEQQAEGALVLSQVSRRPAQRAAGERQVTRRRRAGRAVTHRRTADRFRIDGRQVVRRLRRRCSRSQRCVVVVELSRFRVRIERCSLLSPASRINVPQRDLPAAIFTHVSFTLSACVSRKPVRYQTRNQTSAVLFISHWSM